MRKVFVCTCMITIALLLGATAQAADKIAFVDIKRIMSESDAGKESTEEIMRHVEQKRGEIQARETELEKLQKELERQRSVMTEAAYRERELDYQRRVREYSRFVEDANEEIRMREQSITQSLIPGIQKVVNEVAEREGYTAVFDVGTMGLLFHAGAKDITDTVVQRYNEALRADR